MPTTSQKSWGLPPPEKAGRIAVAMSGGVDSSVAALLLKEAGYDLIGLTLQLYDHGKMTQGGRTCCAGQDIMDARHVAQRLGIPHYVLDYQERFQKSVIEDFVKNYREGRTPSPCIRCNERVKFRDLLAFTKEIGAERLATGHYVRRRKGSRRWEIHRARDETRDQSYFLFTMKDDQIAQSVFPLGDWLKKDVREKARQESLTVAKKADSQDICFVPEGRYWELVEKMDPRPPRGGEILHQDGRVLGRHEGVHRFTPGQRRIGIAEGAPLYVLKIDAAKAEVIVGPKEALLMQDMTLEDVNWLGDGDFSDIAQGFDIGARWRSHQTIQSATLFAKPPSQALLRFPPALEAAAPGQACVFYGAGDKMDRMLGGGWIRSQQL